MKKKKIEISVIMGVYNPKSRAQLQQAVRSVINQTFQEWEMLICDDGSDKSYIPIIEETSKLDERIILIRNEKN